MSKTVSLGLVLACVLVVVPALAQDGSSSSIAPDMSSSMASSTAPDVSSNAPLARPEVAAPDQATIEAWQGVISSQIQAFRVHDSPGALKFASAEFQKSFTDPELFYKAIIGSGYQPIADSKSESFGPFQLLTEDAALQDVRLTGADQSVYEAIYQMVREAAGWRVSGVQLVKTKAIGV